MIPNPNPKHNLNPTRSFATVVPHLYSAFYPRPANGGGGGLGRATCRRQSGQLSFEGRWNFLLNDNSRVLVADY